MKNRSALLLTAALAAVTTAVVMPAEAAAKTGQRDIFEMLATDGAEVIPIQGPVQGFYMTEDCPVSFSLHEERPVIRVAPVDEIREDGMLVAWWESDQLLEIAADGTWKEQKRYEGDALRALAGSHPYLGMQWYFSSPAALNSPVRLVGVTAFVLPINNEAKVFLEFEPSDSKIASTEGVLSTAPLPGFTDFSITPDSDREHLTLISRVLEDELSGSPVKMLHRFGTDVLHVQWEIVDRNPIRAGFLFERGGRLYWAADAPHYYKRTTPNGRVDHDQRFAWAYDLNGDGLPALQFRVEGRYSSFDEFFSLTADGMRRCAMRIIGSD